MSGAEGSAEKDDMTYWARTFMAAVSTAALCAAFVAPVHADLKYTMRIETRKNTGTVVAPSNPIMTMLGSVVAAAMAPAGGLEITVTIGEEGSRVEYNRAYTVVPAGGVTLMRPGGAMIVLDPAKRTYWRMDRPDVGTLMPTPAVTVTRTGEIETIAGVRSERAALEIRVPLPLPAEQLPAGVPAEMVVVGEAWLADRYQEYARLSIGMTGLASMGLERLAAEGLPMRSVLRGEMFGDRQIESIVTAISELAVPASAFEIPEGYTEVAPPAGLAGLGG
jgi:hypothetical protein